MLGMLILNVNLPPHTVRRAVESNAAWIPAKTTLFAGMSTLKFVKFKVNLP